MVRGESQVSFELGVLLCMVQSLAAVMIVWVGFLHALGLSFLFYQTHILEEAWVEQSSENYSH